jgi:hypothetical protein
MHHLVQRAIESICQSRDEGDWKSLDEGTLSDLVQEFGESDLADRLYKEIPTNIPFEIVCDLFNLLAWRTNDNGSSVTRTIENWLRDGSDKRKNRIALNLDVYPFIDSKEMDRVLSCLAEKDAYLHYRCYELIENRRNGR